MAYNPFNKPIEDLHVTDLDVLKTDQVAEGYWVEYKRDFPSNDKIAKSVASFANTYGGWYFIGVEADKKQNTVTDICGFSLASVPDPISTTRDIIKSHIDPIPVFRSKLIRLNDDRAVLVVHVPDDQETPFITRDGRIYRRVSDASDPVPETNRYAVDRLVDQGQEVSKKFTEFCRDERTFSKAEKGQAWLNIFLSPYPLGTIDKLDDISTDGIKRLKHLSQEPLEVAIASDARRLKIGTVTSQFNFGQIALGSVVLRQATQAAEVFNQPTAELFHDGKAKFLMPLAHIQDIEQVMRSSVSNQAIDALREVLRKRDNLSLLHFLDMANLCSAVIFSLGFYQAWLGRDMEKVRIRAAMVLKGLWRTVPFCDTDLWGEYVRNCGLPVLHQDIVKIPKDISRGFFFDLEEEGTFWLTGCGVLCVALGFPIELVGGIFTVLERRAAQST